MKVVVIIPTYNEKGNIERLINTLETDVFPQIKNHEMNILVADDNSPDGTAEEVKKLMKEWENIEINQGERHGLGAAYVRAMTYAVDKMNAEIMFEMDADLSHDPHKIPDFLKKIDEGYDFVIGTRYSQGGSIPSNWGIHRKMFSVFGNLLVRFILLKFSIHDWTGGFRAIKKEVFLKEKPALTAFRGYTFQVSFLNKVVVDGYKVAEVPIHFTDRTLGRSKIAPKEYIIDLLKYVITASIKEKIFGSFGKFLVVGGFGFFLQLVVYRFIITSTTFPLGLSNLLSAQLAIFSNYNLNNLWTFRKEKAKSPRAYILKMLGFFASSNTGVFFIQSGLIQLGEILFGREFPLPYVYFVLATGVLLVYNFSMYRFVIWRRKPHK